jgi:NTP pyrophosphatase (non-canonical NTP hydrolase)
MSEYGYVEVLAEVAVERHRQDAKLGEQNHLDFVWNAILGEEVGEVANAILEGTFSDAPLAHVRDELVQVAAVAVAWVEAIDRRR